MSRFFIPAVKEYRQEDVIKRSRFIVTLAHVRGAREAREFVAKMQQEFPDATHNCWAWQAGAAGDSAVVGMSDDGEPHGTAGKPMLNVLLHSGIGEIGAVVTRYFGGTKLGTGGLVRAYSGMVQLGLDTLPVKEKITPVYLEIIMEYTAVTLFKRLLPEFEVEVCKEEYGADASFCVVLPQEHQEGFWLAVDNICNGQCLISVLDSPEGEIS